MDQLKAIIRQFRDLFLKMNGSQQLSIISFGLAVLILLGVFINSAMKPSPEQPLFFNLSQNDAASITEKLTDMSIPWELTRGGSIMVGSDVNIQRLRMSLAQEGVLPDDMSFGFDKMIEAENFSLTRDERDKRYLMALQTEVASNINAMADISEAKVLITEEEPSPLIRTHMPRKASVRVKVRGNRMLTKTEVKGITMFVASSVKGLDPGHVSIIDGRGRPYSINDGMDAGNKLEMTWRAEHHYAQKIESHLLEFIPRVKATVSLTLDLAKHRREVKDYSSDELKNNGSSVLVTNFQEKKNSESKEGSQGVAGAGTNSSAEIREGDGGTAMTTGESKKEEVFDNSIVQDFIEFDGMKMQVLGVSVVVADKEFVISTEDAEGQPKYKEADWLDPSNKLIEHIANAVGIRTDSTPITVTQQTMEMPAEVVEPGFMGSAMAFLDKNHIMLFMGFLSLLGAALLIRMVKKAQPEEEILEMPVFEEDDKEDDLPPLKEPDKDPKVRQVENRVKEIVDEDPVKAASLIRNWLSSE